MKKYIVAILFALGLAACGGGGGDPGTCSGSAEWCAESAGSGSSAAPTASFIRIPDSDLYSITCLQILALNGQNEVMARAAANDAYARGNSDLDGSPKNGVPCDSYF